MKEMTADDLRALKHGDRVYRKIGIRVERFDYVGRMPRSEGYLIFCHGENLTHLYISPKDDSFHNTWYGGEYDSAFVGRLIIAEHKDRIASVERIYLKTETFEKLMAEAKELGFITEEGRHEPVKYL